MAKPDQTVASKIHSLNRTLNLIEYRIVRQKKLIDGIYNGKWKSRYSNHILAGLARLDLDLLYKLKDENLDSQKELRKQLSIGEKENDFDIYDSDAEKAKLQEKQSNRSPSKPATMTTTTAVTTNAIPTIEEKKISSDIEKPATESNISSSVRSSANSMCNVTSSSSNNKSELLDQTFEQSTKAPQISPAKNGTDSGVEDCMAISEPKESLSIITPLS